MSSRSSGISSFSIAMACGGLAVALAAAIVGVIVIVTPEDADQGISQKIFYFHVPIALTAYACFGLGAWKALLLLWKGRERHDLESYTAIHQGTIFGSLTLITGSLWAKASWGHWWLWSSNQLVLFLVLFLFYCAYFMLRFSIDPGARRARISAVYALFGVALIPVSFFAIRLAEDIIHPTTFTLEGPQMDGSQFAGFLVSWAAIVALAYVMYRVELTGKRADLALRELGERQGVSSIVSAAPTRVGVPRAGLQPDAAGAIQRSGLSAGTAGLKSDGSPEERA